MTRVLIVGGGFGGIYTARYLEPLVKSGQIEVTLVNRDNYFLFTPLLHEVATGGLTPTSVVEPIREIFRDTPIRFVQAEVKSIDVKRRLVSTSAGKLHYDYLVLSLGAETNFYNTPGADKYALGLKNLTDAIRIRGQIIESFERAVTTIDLAERSQLLSVVVVGGGPTGVELAAELADFMGQSLYHYYQAFDIKREEIKVTLVCTSTEILPQFPGAMRPIAEKILLERGVEIRKETKATEITADEVKLDRGSPLATHNVIWVAGVAPRIWSIEGAGYESSGRLHLDEYLRVSGFENIFALGDVSGTLPMLAQVAVRQAKVVAKNLASSLAHEPLRAFHYHQKGLLVSLGQWRAVGHFFGQTYQGGLMWWIWRTVYLFNFLSWRKRFKIATEWTVNLFYPRDITRLSL